MPKIWNKKLDKNIPPDAVYVGRPSKWGNPYAIAISEDHNRAYVIQKYKEYIDAYPQLKEAVKVELKGKDLVCWCAPLDCHARILMEIANE